MPNTVWSKFFATAGYFLKLLGVPDSGQLKTKQFKNHLTLKDKTCFQ